MNMNNKPKFSQDEMYMLLREGKIAEFNEARRKGKPVNLKGTNLRMLDLRGLNADGLDLSDTYLRQCDLRGLDLTNTNLEGASIHGAHISGAYFPKSVSSSELRLSLDHGTRLRYRDGL